MYNTIRKKNMLCSFVWNIIIIPYFLLLHSSSFLSPSQAFSVVDKTTIIMKKKKKNNNNNTKSSSSSLSATSSSASSSSRHSHQHQHQHHLRLITNRMCPFAQKAWIALELCSGMPFAVQEISLYGAGGKPAWFWELNPAGTVPVLVVVRVVDRKNNKKNNKKNGANNNADNSSSSSSSSMIIHKDDTVAVFPDSDLILQAIADGSLAAALGGGLDALSFDNNDNNSNNNNNNPLLSYPISQQQQQQESIQQWRHAIDQMLPIGKQAVLSGRRKQQQIAALQQYLHDNLECRLSAIMSSSSSSCSSLFLVGDHVTIADCHAFPFLWRLDQEFGLDDSLKCPKLAAWVQHCSQIPAFAKTLPTSSWWWWW